MIITRFVSGENSASIFVFKHCCIEGITSDYDNCDYYLQLKVKKFAHSRIFKDRSPNSRTFQGLEFSFAISRTFQEFQGPWQPCN